jgi:hypothetical protein
VNEAFTLRTTPGEIEIERVSAGDLLPFESALTRGRVVTGGFGSPPWC